jgi:GNAT superfamily N-acetyltransferase
MLLGGRGMVLDFQSSPQAQGAIFQQDIGLAVIVGTPDAQLLAQVAELADELICPINNAKYMEQAFQNWSREDASLMQLPDSIDPAELAVAPSNNTEDTQIRILKPEELEQIGDIPEPLREELKLELDAGTRIYSTIHHSDPVAFCFPASCSESLWDVSLDTLSGYRRAGYAEQCVRYAIRAMAEKGYAPVWGVVDSNHASRALAEKLGFEERYRIAVLTRNN